jgi:hypothetical protein
MQGRSERRHNWEAPRSRRIDGTPTGFSGRGALTREQYSRLQLVTRTRIFLPWRWWRYVPTKSRFTQDLHGATSQKTALFTVWKLLATNCKVECLCNPPSADQCLWILYKELALCWYRSVVFRMQIKVNFRKTEAMWLHTWNTGVRRSASHMVVRVLRRRQSIFLNYEH